MAPRRRPLNAYIVLAFVLIGGYWAWAAWQTGRFEDQFTSLADAGQSTLAAVEALALEGDGKGQPHETYSFRSDPPTSGRHHPETVTPGFYETQQDDARLVHALKHGSVVIYFDQPDAATRTDLRRWTAFYRGNEWAGLIVSRRPGIGQTVILTAWGRKLALSPFFPAAAAAFIDRYRGRGPEKQVR